MTIFDFPPQGRITPIPVDEPEVRLPGVGGPLKLDASVFHPVVYPADYYRSMDNGNNFIIYLVTKHG